MTSAQQRVDELLSVYGDAGACVADLLCDRHPPDAVAFTVVESDLTSRQLTYGELRERSQRFATMLADLGVQPGDRVATLMGKSVDLVSAVVGIWRRGAVYIPLFTAFGAAAIAMRLTDAEAKVVVVDASQRAKLLPGDDMPPEAPWQVVVAGDATDGDRNLDALLAAARPDDPRAAAVAVGGDAEFVRLFTSGTTGAPKGVEIPVRAIASFVTYFEYGLGVEPDDVFWNAADPGWAYGLYYGVIAPLATGHANILLRAGFSAELTFQVLSRFRVTNFTSAPTVFRVLRSESALTPDNLALRRCSSAGEPLNPEMVSWSKKTLGVPIHDTYGQTELGMAAVNGWHPDIARPVKPGSMGHPMPGWCIEVLKEDSDDIASPGEPGRLAVDLANSPLMWFTKYANDPKKTAERFTADHRFYLTGDVGAKDDEGYLSFSGRDDDVIIMAGYRISPFDIESVLISHPDVAEAAVIAVPDELRGEVIEAFVALRPGVEGSDQLARELQQLVKEKFAAHAYPRLVHFVNELPKTSSGKVQKYVLRNQRRNAGG